jgi:hypothetical protein
MRVAIKLNREYIVTDETQAWYEAQGYKVIEVGKPKEADKDKKDKPKEADKDKK